MGTQEVRGFRSAEERRAFTAALLDELEAFEIMWADGRFESGARRMGVEQELFLVDANGRPAPVAMAALEALDRPDFTTELARYNLEANLDPAPLSGPFLSALERDLQEAVEAARVAAAPLGAAPLLVGILPTLERGDMSLENITPRARYRALNDGLMRERGGACHVQIHGVDALEVTWSSVMMESSSTSFQLHLQVDPDDFAAAYNRAQAISAPLLAAACNAPLVLGRRLWRESRIAMFAGAADSRSPAQRDRGAPPRVGFGERWVRASPAELFREDALRFRPVLTRDVAPGASARARDGEDPPLRALALHNGTVWRWNRACFGPGPHVRVENRVLPAGPTVRDEVANAALFYGLMEGLRAVDFPARMRFDDASANLLSAARYGLDARLKWLDGRDIAARALLLEDLLPAAREGLAALGAPAEEIERYLGVIRDRVETGRTGARWALDAFEDLAGVPGARSRALTLSMMAHQATGLPVHSWPSVRPADAPERRTLSDIMSGDVFTVRLDDAVDLAEATMRWRHVRHVPVEDGDGVPVGLIRHTALLEAHRRAAATGRPVPVADVMEPPPPCVSPRDSIRRGLAALIASGQSCQLVVEDGRIIGLVTDSDYTRALGG